MYCTTCGKELPDGSRICDECGTCFIPEENPEDIERRPYMDYQPFSSGPEGSDSRAADKDTRQNSADTGNPCGQSGPSPYGPNSYGKNPYGQNSYGTSYEQAPYHQNPYSQYSENEPEGPDRTGMAIAGLVVGIIAVCCCCLPILNIPLGVLAVIFSILGMKSSCRGLAIAGLVLGIVSLVLGMMMLLILVMEDGFHFSYYWDLFD